MTLVACPHSLRILTFADCFIQTRSGMSMWHTDFLSGEQFMECHAAQFNCDLKFQYNLLLSTFWACFHLENHELECVVSYYPFTFIIKH